MHIARTSLLCLLSPPYRGASLNAPENQVLDSAERIPSIYPQNRSLHAQFKQLSRLSFFPYATLAPFSSHNWREGGQMTIGERPTRASPYPKPKHIRRVLTECIRGSRDDPQFTTKMTAAAAAFESNSVLPLCPPATRGSFTVPYPLS